MVLVELLGIIFFAALLMIPLVGLLLVAAGTIICAIAPKSKTADLTADILVYTGIFLAYLVFFTIMDELSWVLFTRCGTKPYA